MEHSYWSFVEAHPAHRGTSERDRDEAMEFLAWCLADQLVQTEAEHGNRYPFTLAQCRELMELVRSVDGTYQWYVTIRHNPDLFFQLDGQSHGRSAMIKTRIVAKISLRNGMFDSMLPERCA